MPRYHFHVADGRDYPDLQGTELADLAAARYEALRFTGSLLADHEHNFWNGADWSMRVTDAIDLTLFTLNFSATNAPCTQGS
jgi:hypothetical protein